MAVNEITKDNFEAEVKNSDKPVLIDFWASWCGPCVMLSPIVDEVSEEVSDRKFCKVNVNEQPELAAAFGISNIPALFYLKDGKIVSQSVGLIPKAEIMKLIEK